MKSSEIFISRKFKEKKITQDRGEEKKNQSKIKPHETKSINGNIRRQSLDIFKDRR